MGLQRRFRPRPRPAHPPIGHRRQTGRSFGPSAFIACDQTPPGSALYLSWHGPPRSGLLGRRLCPLAYPGSRLGLGIRLNLGEDLLPHQHALLLLRQCIQQDLRHLQRSLPDHPLINDQWTRLDRALWNEVRRLRGRVNQRQGDRQELEDAILSLPLRLGGLGVLSTSAWHPMPWQPRTTQQTDISTRS